MSKWWEGYDWRLIQTNLREIDMSDINAKQYVKDLKSFHANIVMINAAGIIASYPTKLKYHYQSRFLTGDSLKTIIEECHKENIKVFARMDFSKVRREIYEAHPEWAYRTVSNNIVDYEGDVHVCVNGGYQHDYALEIIRECITEHDFDGIFFNMGGYQVRDYSSNYYGICHCRACKTLFKEMYGLPLPQKEDMNDPIFRKYRLFKIKTTQAHNERVYRFVKEIRPDMLIDSDFYTENSGIIRQESNTALDRPLPHWQYAGSHDCKWVRSSFKNYIASINTVDFWDFPIRHTAVSSTLQETRLWQNLANTGHLDYYLIGRLDNHDDTSGYEGIKRVYAYHEKNQALYRDNKSIAEIAIIRPDFWNGLKENREMEGLYRILTENHYLFDVVLLSRINHVDLKKYKLLVLPDLKSISDKEAETIDNFVRDGGKLICTGRTGIYDEEYEERKVPVLKCMGTKDTGLAQNARGAYFRISDSEHGTFKHFNGVNLVCIDGDYIYATYDEGVQRILSMIPPQPFGPPERCYPLYPAGENPGAVLKYYGKGQCVTIPWYPGCIFHRQGYPNTMNFVLDIIENVLSIKPIKTDLPPMVEVTLSQTSEPGSYLLHFVNQTGHFGNSFYPPIVIQTAKCTVPFYKRPNNVRSLISGNEVPFSYNEGELTIHVEQLGIVEAIHIIA